MLRKLTAKLAARLEHAIGWLIWKLFVQNEVNPPTPRKATARINNRHHE